MSWAGPHVCGKNSQEQVQSVDGTLPFLALPWMSWLRVGAMPCSGRRRHTAHWAVKAGASLLAWRN